jgi:hypothetical protein
VTILSSAVGIVLLSLGLAWLGIFPQHLRVEVVNRIVNVLGKLKSGFTSS